MKLLANENIPAASVAFLRSGGFDVAWISEIERGISDREVLEIADIEHRLIVTFDRDYGELIYKHNVQPTAGVLYLRLETYSPEEPGRIVQRLISQMSLKLRGRLTVYDGTNVRQRIYLPE